MQRAVQGCPPGGQVWAVALPSAQPAGRAAGVVCVRVALCVGVVVVVVCVGGGSGWWVVVVGGVSV
jgi:hypothetical protein